MPKQNVLTRSKKKKALEHFHARRLPQAQAALEEICRLDRVDAEAWLLLAAVHTLLGVWEQAEACCRKALELDPRSAPAWTNLGNVYAETGRHDQAADSYRRALALRPDYVEAHGNLGLSLAELGRYDEALACYHQALALQPASAEVHNNLGLVHLEQGRHEQALACFRKTLQFKPDCAEAYNNIGYALYKQGVLAQAAGYYQQALRLRPPYPEAHNNLGLLLAEHAQYSQACDCFRRAIALRPGFPDAHRNLAAYELLQGHFAEGWQHYIYASYGNRGGEALPAPQPLAADLAGRRLLLMRDQGLGDELFFLRFAALLKARGAELSYRPNPKLASLLRRVDCIDRVADETESPQGYDTAMLVAILPLVLDMDNASKIPPPLALSVLPERLEALSARVAALGPPPYVGVTWRAGTAGRQRVLYKESPPHELATVLKNLPATVLVLQRLPEAGEIEDFTRALERPAHDLSALNDDIEDMLALLALLDDYVGVSNTNMHLMAGLGKTARVLVPHPPEWRWMAEGEESPWFRGFKVYRQGYNGEWRQAFQELKRDMKQIFGGTESVQP